MLPTVRSLLELIRFSHTLFALPFALTSAVLAWKLSGFHTLQLAGILLCMVFARSAAMAFNRLADRRFDALNPRTTARHLPAGRLSAGAVWLFTLLCAAGFIASTTIFLYFDNPYPLYLSIPVLLFLCAYSYTKRFTSLSHVWLGASLGLSPLAAWIAIRGIISMTDLAAPLVLGGAVLCWVAGFDIFYACQDVDFDRKARLHSIPATLGVRASLRVAALCHLFMLLLLVALYWAAAPNLGIIYLTGVAATALLLLYEHWLVRPDDLSRVNQAFFQVNGIISVGLFVVVVVQLVV
ncbi:MAG TPA: UbiA-like polyprenyltransferase [Gemmataceae bacterium]|nr:UbiA-like polyprenyltransferase [Gemmataceae bacterium]